MYFIYEYPPAVHNLRPSVRNNAAVKHNSKYTAWRPNEHIWKQNRETFKYHNYVGFLSNLRPLPPYDGILTFSANPLSPYDVFNQPPAYTVNRESGTVLSFFSHYKSYMTVWPTPLPSPHMMAL